MQTHFLPICSLAVISELLKYNFVCLTFFYKTHFVGIRHEEHLLHQFRSVVLQLSIFICFYIKWSIFETNNEDYIFRDLKDKICEENEKLICIFFQN